MCCSISENIVNNHKRNVFVTDAYMRKIRWCLKIWNILSLLNSFRNRSNNRDVTATKAGRRVPGACPGRHWAAPLQSGTKEPLTHKGLLCEGFKVRTGPLLLKDWWILPGVWAEGFIPTTWRMPGWSKSSLVMLHVCLNLVDGQRCWNFPWYSFPSKMWKPFCLMSLNPFTEFQWLKGKHFQFIIDAHMIFCFACFVYMSGPWDLFPQHTINYNPSVG